MKCILISQRVDIVEGFKERRDSLDQRWANLLLEVGCIGIPIPNNVKMLNGLLTTIHADGILLTGGNSPVSYGGYAGERDDADNLLISYALSNDIPLLGVCRGMQSVVEYFGGSLHKVKGHVATRHSIDIGHNVNSFHEYAPRIMPDTLTCLAYAEDGEAECIRHKELPIFGIMWHPERESPFSKEDIKFIRNILRIN